MPMDLLREPQASPPDGHLRRIVEAFVNPVLAMRASSEGEYYTQLVGRELAYRTPIPSAYWSTTSTPWPMPSSTPCAQRARAPRATQVASAYQFAMGALLHHLIDHRVERPLRAVPTHPTTRKRPRCSSISWRQALLLCCPSRPP